MKKSIYNLVFGILSQVITLALGIIIPKIYITNLGSEVNGLMTSINQLFAYIALLEAGIGNASLQALYKPLSHEDRDGVNSILAATDHYYKITGIEYFVAVIALALLYPFAVKSTLPWWTISAVILLTGIPGSINFLFQGKYKVLLQAEGKQYFVNIINTVVNVAVNLARILLVLLGYSIIFVQISYCIIQTAQMILYYIYVKKKYSWLDFKVHRNDGALSQRHSVFIHQISGLVFSNTDNLILSFFCGFSTVSVYSVYSLISGTVSTLINTINDSFVYILGYEYNNSLKEFTKKYDVMECVIGSIMFALYTIMYLLFTPFISLYTKGADINYVDSQLVFLFIIFQILNAGRKIPQNAINVAGHFKKTQNRALMEAGINLVSTLILVPICGIYGALAGTILALIYRTNDIIIYTNLQILERKPWKTYKRWLVNMGVLILYIWCLKKYISNIDSYWEFLLQGVVLLFVVTPGFILISYLMNREEYKYAIRLAKSAIIHHK